MIEKSLRSMMGDVHCMVDLETMSAAGNASIVQIGAVAFRCGDEPGTFLREYRRCVSLNGQDKKYGLDVDTGTIQWWMDQVKEHGIELIDLVFNKNGQLPLVDALREFRSFYDGRFHGGDLPSAVTPVDPCKRLWGHGSTFDCVIVNNAYRAVDSRSPSGFRDARDTRTLFEMVGGGNWSSSDGIDMESYGPKHDGLADAKRQAVVVQRAFRALALPHLGAEGRVL